MCSCGVSHINVYLEICVYRGISMEDLFPIETIPPPQRKNNIETGIWRHQHPLVSLLSCPSPDNTTSQPPTPWFLPNPRRKCNKMSVLVLPDASITDSGRLQAGSEIAAEVGHKSELVHTLLVFWWQWIIVFIHMQLANPGVSAMRGCGLRHKQVIEALTIQGKSKHQPWTMIMGLDFATESELTHSISSSSYRRQIGGFRSSSWVAIRNPA